MQDTKRVVRRRHDDELKRRVLEECGRSGASVASVAMAHGLNTNLVHKWRRSASQESAPLRVVATKPEFVPVNIAPTAVPEIRVELRRGAMEVSVAWPLSAMPECAAWLREILR